MPDPPLRHPLLLDPESTVLLVVDVQERFRAAMAGFDRMVGGVVRLVRAFHLLDLPVLATEQYPKGLGPTVPEVLDALNSGRKPVTSIPSKLTFSSHGSKEIATRLGSLAPSSVVVVGIEAHVCVQQTAHDLLTAGMSVHVPLDAVESRHPHDKEAALRRLEQAGAVITTCEMAAFELLEDAGHPAFKEVQALFKG